MKILSLLVAFALLVSCSKEKETPPCTTSLTITNTSTNPYDIYYDNVLLYRMNGGTTQIVENVSIATHTVKVVQVSGYILYPTEQTFAGTAKCGEISNVIFPK